MKALEWGRNRWPTFPVRAQENIESGLHSVYSSGLVLMSLERRRTRFGLLFYKEDDMTFNAVY